MPESYGKMLGYETGLRQGKLLKSCDREGGRFTEERGKGEKNI